MKEGFQLRSVYSESEVRILAKNISKIYPKFNTKAFISDILKTLETLSFGDRSRIIKEALTLYLPQDFKKSASILIQALPKERVEDELTGWEGFMIIPQTEYIAEHGLEHFDIAMNALYEMTKRFSSEMAIRHFIIAHPDKCFSLFMTWVSDANPHVRRLVSEGSRPRLPLAIAIPQLKKDPTPIIPFLDILKDDPILYVRRSVANNINDISKDNPDLAVEILKKWNNDTSPESQWVISHSARTLIKRCNPQILTLFGYAKPIVSVSLINVSPKPLYIGDTLLFSATITSEETQSLLIDYKIGYTKANGKIKTKVFKLNKKQTQKGETFTISKKHSFKQMSTRKHYPGTHTIELLINGETFSQKEFTVLPTQ